MTRPIRALFAAFAFACVLAPAHAEEVVRIVVPAPPGGNLDTTARALAQRLTAMGPDTVIVENRTGADTSIAADYVAHSAPDGRTILITGSASLIAAWTQAKLNYSFMDDLKPVAQVSNPHFLLASAAGSPIGSIADMAAEAAKRPGGLNCGASPGAAFLACEQLRLTSGGKVTTIPFQGVVPAITALLGGHVDVVFSGEETLLPHMESGKVRALASSWQAGRGVPLFDQISPDFFLAAFIGLFVPSATPPDVVKRLHAQVNRVLVDPAYVQTMQNAGVEITVRSTGQFESVVKTSYSRTGDVTRRLGLARR